MSHYYQAKDLATIFDQLTSPKRMRLELSRRVWLLVAGMVTLALRHPLASDSMRSAAGELVHAVGRRMPRAVRDWLERQVQWAADPPPVKTRRVVVRQAESEEPPFGSTWN